VYSPRPTNQPSVRSTEKKVAAQLYSHRGTAEANMNALLAILLVLCSVSLVFANVVSLEELREKHMDMCEKCRDAECTRRCAAQLNRDNAVSGLTIPFNYPLYKQCDDPWGPELMGNKTVCAVGCLMSSTASGLGGDNIQIPQADSSTMDATPGSLNTWLKLNGGYSNNNLIESAIPKINPSRISWPADGMHPTNDLPYATVCQYIAAGRVVVGNVMNGGHFVLLIGYSETDGDTFAVNDSGFDTLQYSYSKDIVGYRIYDMVRQ